MTSGRVSGMSLCKHKGLLNDTKNKFNNHHIGRKSEHFVFGGHVSAQDGKNDLDLPGTIIPIVLFIEILKEGNDSDGWCPGF